MKNNHTVNKVRGIPDFAYITFDKAYNLVEPLTKVGGSANIKKFYELIGRKKTGWLGLEIKSARAWGLIENKKMVLTPKFHKLSSSNDPKEKTEIKRESFLNIPLFKELIIEYFEEGLPGKKELTKILETKYKINPTYAPSVAKTLLDSEKKYFDPYDKRNMVEYGSPMLVMNNEPFDEKKYIMNIKVTSSKGIFNLNVINKEGIEIAQKLIKDLWEGERDTDKNQEEVHMKLD